MPSKPEDHFVSFEQPIVHLDGHRASHYVEIFGLGLYFGAVGQILEEVRGRDREVIVVNAFSIPRHSDKEFSSWGHLVFMRKADGWRLHNTVSKAFSFIYDEEADLLLENLQAFIDLRRPR